jgi:hypothetical protein
VVCSLTEIDTPYIAAARYTMEARLPAKREKGFPKRRSCTARSA